MTFWLVLFAIGIITLGFSFIFIIKAVGRFYFVKNISGENKKKKTVISAGIVLITLVLLGLAFNMINAAMIFIHLLLIWILCDGVNLILKKYLKKESKFYYAGIAAVFITVIYMSIGWYYCHHVYETHYDIKVDKELNSKTLKVVQISDSHVGTVFDGDKFLEYIKDINKLEPDIVLVTGDLIDDDTFKEDMVKTCRALGELKTQYGVYFSFGNHDKGYYSAERRGYTVDDFYNEMKKNNINILEDESVLIDDSFYIIGRRDGYISDRKKIAELVKALDESKTMIVMDHEPMEYDEHAKAKVDLVLSGHTHGGQFFPVNNLGEWLNMNCRTYGYEKRDNTNFIVSSGIADWAIKFKTGCISEYNVITISK